ncbi:hypothetical protein GN958_ATG17304 [Phytophthora infestans]|uniref:Uncharacterized protein n=1 Tax=Phytophthora infestans TaxID=4787 RepID=A0A8S9U2X9_PHYIN|nr:hypothetical protein GN958_ATG17304 [Phytophthora infestans]
MLHQYLKLLELLDLEDDDLTDLSFTPTCNRCPRSLFEELKEGESVAKALQGNDADLLDVRCARVLRGNTSSLGRAEKADLSAFNDISATATPAGNKQEGFFVERIQKRIRLVQQEQRFAYAYGNSLHPITLEQILFLRQDTNYWDVHTADSLRS